MRFPRLAAIAAIVSLPLALGAQARGAAVFTPGSLNANQQLAHDIYKELIEINTGVTTGNVTTAAVAMARRFRDAGIPEADIFVGGPRPEKHNVVARIRGKAGAARKPLLLLAHIDVVEALKLTGPRTSTRSSSPSATATTTAAVRRTIRPWRRSSSRTPRA